MQRVWVRSWEMLLTAGAEGKPHVAAPGLQSLLLLHACVTPLLTAPYLQRASYEKEGFFFTVQIRPVREHTYNF